MIANPFTTTVQKVIIGGLGAAVVALGAALVVQHSKLQTARVSLSQQIAERATETAERNAAALAYATNLAKVKADHDQAQQAQSERFAAELQRLTAAGDADMLRAQRLLNSTEARAASYRAAAEAGPAACQRLADRSVALDGLVAEGRGLVAQGRAIVERRDAEVSILKSVVENDRSAIQSAMPEQQ